MKERKKTVILSTITGEKFFSDELTTVQIKNITNSTISRQN